MYGTAKTLKIKKPYTNYDSTIKTKKPDHNKAIKTASKKVQSTWRI